MYFQYFFILFYSKILWFSIHTHFKIILTEVSYLH